jgi:general secretion pathway protein C
MWIVRLVVIGTCASFAGRTAAHLLSAGYLVVAASPPRAHQAPATEQARSKEARTLERNIFCSGCAAPHAHHGGGDDGPRPTTLELELVSTLIAPSDEKWSMAIMRDLSTRQRDPAMYNRGATVAGAVVVKVLPRRVYLRNGRRLEYVDLEAASALPSPPREKRTPPTDPLLADLDRDVRCGGGRCALARTLVTKLLGNTAILATSIHVMPLSHNGRGAGFRVDAIRPGSLFARLQLQNGDTLKAVNGTELTTPDAALALYKNLMTASHVSLQVERNGRTQTLDYTIE